MTDNDSNDVSTVEHRLEQRVPTSAPERVTTNSVTAGQTPATDRQHRIEGFDQVTLETTRVLLVGAGGIGGEVADGLVKKGVGELIICDEDTVDETNLNRQQFREADIGTNKARALAERLAPRGTAGTDITARPRHFQDALAVGADFDPDLVVCAPDNDEARLAVADRYHGSVPVVFTGLDTDANGGYVFVQDTAAPCFRCYRPHAGGGGACAAAAATADPTKVVGGLTLFAVDTVLMDRHREWDAFEFYLAGVLPTRPVTVDRHPDCQSCRSDL